MPGGGCYTQISLYSTSPLFRLVYRWFLLIYQVTYALGIIGYTVLIFTFTGLGLVLPTGPEMLMEAGVVLIFYGVYFGVMGRDCAELCVDYMSAGMTVSHLLKVTATSNLVQ